MLVEFCTKCSKKCLSRTVSGGDIEENALKSTWRHLNLLPKQWFNSCFEMENICLLKQLPSFQEGIQIRVFLMVWRAHLLTLVHLFKKMQQKKQSWMLFSGKNSHHKKLPSFNQDPVSQEMNIDTENISTFENT